jgi:hypothetical protein
MPRKERMRQATEGFISLQDLQTRSAAGWKLVALEWERETAEEETFVDPFAEEIPYGLQISQDCQRLERNPDEYRVLAEMMELLIQDLPLSQVAIDLNKQGMRTRSGHLWTQISVFEMLPRLTEVSPRIITTKEWEKRRQKLVQTATGLRALQ